MSSSAFKNRYRRRSSEEVTSESPTTDRRAPCNVAVNQTTDPGTSSSLATSTMGSPDSISTGSESSPINRRRQPTPKNSPRLTNRLSYVEDGGVEVLETLKLHHKAPSAPTPTEVLDNYKASRSVDSDVPQVILNRGGSVAKLHNAKLENVVPQPAMDVKPQPGTGIIEEDEKEDEVTEDLGPFGKRLSLKVPAPAPRSASIQPNLNDQDSDSEEEGGSLIDKWKHRTDKVKKDADKVKAVGLTESASVAKARKLQEEKRLQEVAEASKQRIDEIKKQEETAKAAKVTAQQRYMKRMMKQG